MTIRDQIAAWPVVSSDNVFPDYEAMAHHWEDRADAAEARLATATEALRALMGACERDGWWLRREVVTEMNAARAVLDALDKEQH